MKNRTLHYLSLSACALLILSSCGTSNKYAKNKGFGGGFGEGESEKVATTVAPAPTESVTTPGTTDLMPASSETVATDAGQTQTEVTSNAKNTVAFKKNAKLGLKQQLQIAKELKNAAKRSDSKTAPKETNESAIVFILLFILCFIIPPLAYILHKGAADTWFWVDLILFLIAISFFFGFNLGLAGLASVVIALLGLFDVI